MHGFMKVEFINVRVVFIVSLRGLEQLCPVCDKLMALTNVLAYTCLLPLKDSYKIRNTVFML
jgi:hypothetical protein